MSQTKRRLDIASWPVSASLAALATVLVFGVGIWAQWRIDQRPAPVWAWVVLIGGALAFGLISYRQPLERLRVVPAACARAPRIVPLVLALILWGAAFPGFSGNLFRPLPTLAWLAGLVLVYLAFALPHAWPAAFFKGRALGRKQGIVVPWHIVILLVILAVGAYLRLRQLDAIPAEMGVDMPMNYENARDIMQGQFMIFCPRYPGRESLFFYLIALYGKLFSLSFFAIKFTSAFVGLATIATLYGVASDLYNRPAGLLAAALLAVSKWHVILSRTGYRAVLVPLMVLGLIYLTVRALRSARAQDFVLLGMLLGLSLYTYNSTLILPPVLVGALAVEFLLAGRGALARYGWGLPGLVLGALGVYLPLARYALEEPQIYLLRVASRITSAEVPVPHDVLRVLAGNVWRSLGMFNGVGDGMFYINVPFQPELGLISGVLLVCGVAYALLRWRRGHNALVLLFVGAMLLPEALAVSFPQEVPNAVRASGVIAPVYLLASLPLALLYQRFCAWERGRGAAPLSFSLGLPGQRRLSWDGHLSLHLNVVAVVVLVALLGFELRETAQAYFRDYVNISLQGNYSISLEMAKVIDEFAAEGPAYIKVWPNWYEGRAVRAQFRVTPHDWAGEISVLDPTKPPLSQIKGPVLFIVHPDDTRAQQVLRDFIPHGVMINHLDYRGHVAFITFYGVK